jgi:hypothetical protein
MMTLKFLIVFACGFSIGVAAFAICQAEGLSLGMIGTLSTMWLSVLGAATASQIYVLLCEVRIRPKPQET